jgi:cystathionine beta-lyase
METAFRYGDEWLEQVLNYIERNVDLAISFFGSKIPEIVPMRPEGTYLVWLDCNGLGLEHDELTEFFIHDAKVGLNDGATFGPGGEGFMRLNVACPRSILQEGLDRIERAVDKRRE